VLSSGVGISLATMAASRPASAAAASPSAADILKNPGWPESFPFGPSELARYDEAPDTEFYSAPRFVTHIDDAAINALTAYYSRVFPPSGGSDTALLDICSSWISHYPAGYTAGRISGLGMNEAELKRNSILSDYVVADLNATPQLPYPDATFDVVTNAVSVDYLTKPLEVMKEVQRVLKPGGLALMSFSNRCFPTKAIAIWTSTGDLDHIWIVGASA
jgi:SAM-dependent methyltransferase